jgi:hypothetical protein
MNEQTNHERLEEELIGEGDTNKESKNEVRSGIPQTKQPTPADVPIGIDHGESPMEQLPTEISASEAARKWAGKE